MSNWYKVMNKRFKHKYMLFDWVLVNGTPFQIHSLTKKKIGYHKYQTSMSYSILQDVKPIVLTTDFLKLNDFKIIDSSMGYEQYRDEENDVYIHFNGICCYISVNSKIKNIEYIHQLQHYYDFLGIEKKWIF